MNTRENSLVRPRGTKHLLILNINMFKLLISSFRSVMINRLCCWLIFRLQSDPVSSSQQNICPHSASVLHRLMTSSTQDKKASQYLDSDTSFDVPSCEVSDLHGTQGRFWRSHSFTGKVNNGSGFQRVEPFYFSLVKCFSQVMFSFLMTCVDFLYF